MSSFTCEENEAQGLTYGFPVRKWQREAWNPSGLIPLHIVLSAAPHCPKSPSRYTVEPVCNPGPLTSKSGCVWPKGQP